MDSYWLAKKIVIRKLDGTNLNVNIPTELGQFKGLDAKENSTIDKYVLWIKNNCGLKVDYTGVQETKVYFKEIE